MLHDARPLELDATPLQVLADWPVDRPVVFLHSGRLNSEWSRYSVFAEPRGTLINERGRSRWTGPAHPGPFALHDDALRCLDRATRHDDALYLGYLGYELAHAIEPVLGPVRAPPPGPADRAWPDLVMHRCPVAWVYDHRDGRWSVVGPDASDGLVPPCVPVGPAPAPAFDAAAPVPDEPRAAHEARVRRALDYIAAGDVFQVNLAHRFSSGFSGSPRALFAALAAVSPAWYGAYIELPAENGKPPRALASTSPELFLKLDRDGTVTTRPIKGTRAAGPDAGPNGAEEGGDSAEDLLLSAKDAAELNMIIDLLRNDLGRVCSYGSVKVTQPRTIESHPTVHHGVATITGRLHADRRLRHLLRATFPGGSITGAPKVRAMQIIRALEAGPRGPYCGAIGVVRGGTRGGDDPGRTDGAGGPVANLSIAIRTLLVDPAAGRVNFHVGGGIVADSDPADEYAETLHKAEALRQGLAAGRQQVP